jgi:LPXTG-motif cell wall-anchored protein
MKTRIVSILAAAAVFVMAGTVLAQRADPNTGGPTKNTLRMTVTEPNDGAVIVGNAIRVVVAYNHEAFATGQGTKFGEANFPQPRFDVYLDNALKTTLKGTENNVAHLENVALGMHKIVVVALNVSGEIIDRKEIEVRMTAPVQPAAPAPAPAVENVPQAAPPPAPAYEPPAAPAPVEHPKALPATASFAPAFGLAGLGLVAVGLLVARKRR